MSAGTSRDSILSLLPLCFCCTVLFELYLHGASCFTCLSWEQPLPSCWGCCSTVSGGVWYYLYTSFSAPLGCVFFPSAGHKALVLEGGGWACVWYGLSIAVGAEWWLWWCWECWLVPIQWCWFTYLPNWSWGSCGDIAGGTAPGPSDVYCRWVELLFGVGLDVSTSTKLHFHTLCVG